MSADGLTHDDRVRNLLIAAKWNGFHVVLSDGESFAQPVEIAEVREDTFTTPDGQSIAFDGIDALAFVMPQALEPPLPPTDKGGVAWRGVG